MDQNFLKLLTFLVLTTSVICYNPTISVINKKENSFTSNKVKPQAIIHLPDNVFSHETKDTITLDHDHISEYLSSINYIPHTIHKHAQLLAQLDPNQLKLHSQSIGQNHLPLISLTVPEKSSNSEYNSDDVQMKIEDYPQKKPNYNQQSIYKNDDQGYMKLSQQIKYDYDKKINENCDQKNKKNNQKAIRNYNQTPKKEENSYPEFYEMNSYNRNEENQENNNYQNSFYPQVSYQQDTGTEMSDDYKKNENNHHDTQEKINHSTENGINSYSSQNRNEESMSEKTNADNDYSNNYENSPFDYNFVQDILGHVMNQLEHLQLDPDQEQSYQEKTNDNKYNVQNNNFETSKIKNSYEMNNNNEYNENSHMNEKYNNQGISYAYTINHDYDKKENNNNYEASYTSSSTTSQATSLNENIPKVVLDKKDDIKNLQDSTVTYQMPTINLELPKDQIEQIMKMISNRKSNNPLPIIVKSNEFKLPAGLNLGKVKTIAFVKSSKADDLNQLPFISSQLLRKNLNKNSLTFLEKPEQNYDQNVADTVLTAYGYGVNNPSKKFYSSASSNRYLTVPLKKNKKQSFLLQALSSDIKKSVIVPNLQKKKKTVIRSTKNTQKIKK